MSLSGLDDVSPDVTTTNNTWTSVGHFDFGEGRSGWVNAEVIAVNSSGVTARWYVTQMMKRIESGALTLGPGTLVDLISPQKDLAAALWDIRFLVDEEQDGYYFQVKGSNNYNVRWYVTSAGGHMLTHN